MSELSYTVYEPDYVKKDFVVRADELVFVKDGFSFWAMFFSVFWMIYHHLWLPLIGFVVTFGVLKILAYLFGAPAETGGLLFAGLSIAFGFLANDLRRLVLEKEEYNVVGAVVGTSPVDCERRFFQNWAPLVDGQSKGDAS